MVNVLHSIDLEAGLRRHGLHHGSDYVAFYDSTMARFWCPTGYGAQKLAEALQHQVGGHLLTVQEKAAWQIDTCDARNGEFYFLADPGTVIIPNYFQPRRQNVRGMHGYAPDIADNKGIFVLNDGRTKGDVGDVRATQLFHTFLDILGMSEVDNNPDRSARRQITPPPPDAPRYTTILARHEEAGIDDHLGRLCERINALDPARDAIVLSGGFGRGEGSVRRTSDGIYPLNDYDIVLITRTPLRPETLRREEANLAAMLGMDFVDLGVIDTVSLSKLELTQFTFDLKYGSRVLDGDPTILDRLPRFSAGAIPVSEGSILIFNRLAGLLNALPNYESPTNVAGNAIDFMVFQLAKFWIAMGDAYLLLWRGYDASYRVRRQRFADLHASGGVARDISHEVDNGYSFKLTGSGILAHDIKTLLSRLLAALPAALQHLVAAAHDIPVPSNAGLDDTLDAWMRAGANSSERSKRATWSSIVSLLLSHNHAQREAQLRRAATLLSTDAKVDYQALRQVAWRSWEERCHH